MPRIELAGGFRRPSIALAAFTLFCFVVLCALAVWQFARRAEKAELYGLLTARIAAAPIAAPAVGEELPPDYRPVTIAGRFEHAKEMRVYGRSHRGDAGVDIVTPLRRTDGRGVVLVDRGFVPMAQLDPATRAVGQVSGEVTVTGVLRLPSKPGLFTPANDPARNIWFHIDPAEMGRAAGAAPSELAAYVVAGTQGTSGGPIASPVEIELSDNHLHYALTWMALALALPIMFVLYHWRPRSEAGEPE